jgi:hypothetical protein
LELYKKWETIEAQAELNVSQRIAATGLAQYIGIDSSRSWVFYSLSQSEPSIWPEIGPIKIEKRLVNESWQLKLVLRDDEFKQEFAYLCEDLAFKVGGIEDEVSALKSQKAAFEDWIDFFKGPREFSAEQARGLFGELTYMNQQVDNGLDGSEIVAAWRGPLGAPQDFVFDAFKAVEVKTIQSQVTSIRIANEQQLSFPGRLLLKIYRIETNRTPDHGSSLNQLVGIFENRLDSSTKREFRSRLKKLGFKSESRIASESFFSIGDEFLLDALAPSFPKLVSPGIPIGVHSVQYKVSLNAILGKGFDFNES